MSIVLTTEQREQSGSDSYNRFEYQVHWIVCHIIGKLQGAVKTALSQQLRWYPYGFRLITIFRGILMFGLKDHILWHAKKTFRASLLFIDNTMMFLQLDMVE